MSDDSVENSLPPSAKYVAYVLKADGPLSRADLVDETELPEPTVKDALQTLLDRDRVAKTRDIGDLRKVQYEYHPEAEAYE